MSKTVVGLQDDKVLSMDYVVNSSGTKLIDVIYPIGSIYMSFNVTSPSTLFGGTWEQITDRFLYCANSSGNKGGSNTHQHKYGIKVGGYYQETIFAENSTCGLLNYSDDSNWSLSGYTGTGGEAAKVNSAVTSTAGGSITPLHYKYEAKTSATSTMPQYITCYAWHRTA